MSNPKRRSRIQGSWATGASQSQAKSTPKSKVSNTSVTFKSTSTGVCVPQSTSNSQPIPKQSKRFKTNVLQREGEHLLPTQDSHPARIHFFPSFVDTTEASNLFEELLDSLPFEQHSVVIKGKPVPQPRLVAWFGDFGYKYSGLQLHPHAWGKFPTLHSLKAQVEAVTGHTYNTALCNLYRDCYDSVAWHADDEASLGLNPIIASLSFGSTRRFQLRYKSNNAVCACARSAECTCAARADYEIALHSGSLLLMAENVQQAFFHRIPKEYHDRGARINITFRSISDNGV
eukprot:m.112312 g.112312  ORF g.112312 m.112312 type:complete len:288 (+) comp28184_c0_seq2:348-1211(+)